MGSQYLIPFFLKKTMVSQFRRGEHQPASEARLVLLQAPLRAGALHPNWGFQGHREPRGGGLLGKSREKSFDF